MSQTLLYSEAYDFKIFEAEPLSSVCLLFVPRSGSTLLACLMQQTMALGFPLEYFDLVNVPILASRLPGFSLSNIKPLTRVRTSPNGIFSFKLSNVLAEKDKDRLVDLLNVKHFIVVDRQDQEAQARSLATARQTKEWVQLKEEKNRKEQKRTDTNSLNLSEADLEKAREILNRHRDLINEYITKQHIPTLHINYEELLSSPDGTIKRVCDYVNVREYQAVDINKVPISKQA